MTAIHVKTTQECKLTTRLIGASSATLPFSKADAVLGCGQTTTGIFFAQFWVQNAKRFANKTETWMLMDQEILSQQGQLRKVWL